MCIRDRYMDHQQLFRSSIVLPSRHGEFAKRATKEQYNKQIQRIRGTQQVQLPKMRMLLIGLGLIVVYSIYAFMVYQAMDLSASEDAEVQSVLDQTQDMLSQYLEVNFRILDRLHYECAAEAHIYESIESFSTAEINGLINGIRATLDELMRNPALNNPVSPELAVYKEYLSSDLCKILTGTLDELIFCGNALSGVFKRGLEFVHGEMLTIYQSLMEEGTVQNGSVLYGLDVMAANFGIELLMRLGRGLKTTLTTTRISIVEKYSTEIWWISGLFTGFTFFGLVWSGYLLVQSLRRSCLLYTSPSPRDGLLSRMPSSA
eukprot:TRINITY_DN13200_c0_g1_i2.p1 TRINITY_DN13200_c0_g1~~TRINITY_DN13200_c0_g1_i2.p1  ORF type:complete len:318 (+),score=39.23 TRINITY_DN13200_c0_g1_i2:64-1017(+)